MIFFRGSIETFFKMSKEETLRFRIFCDGGARGNPGPAAAAFVVMNSEGEILTKKAKYLGVQTNNYAEYCAVLGALMWLQKQRTTLTDRVEFFLDSQLITNQLTGKFRIKSEKLQRLAERAKELERVIPARISFTAIQRSGNKIADQLVNKTLDQYRERK